MEQGASVCLTGCGSSAARSRPRRAMLRPAGTQVTRRSRALASGAGGAVVATNATGYAVANANFTLPGFYNVSATFPGNTSTTPAYNSQIVYAGCALSLTLFVQGARRVPAALRAPAQRAKPHAPPAPPVLTLADHGDANTSPGPCMPSSDSLGQPARCGRTCQSAAPARAVSPAPRASRGAAPTRARARAVAQAERG